MKKNLLKVFLTASFAVSLCFLSLVSSEQTVPYTIVYTFQEASATNPGGISTTSCNVFANGYQGGLGYLHHTSFGSPTFTTAFGSYTNTGAVVLACAPAAPPTVPASVDATQYNIAFNFRLGYQYSVLIYAAGTAGPTYEPEIAAAIYSVGDGNNTGCGGPANEPTTHFAAYGKAQLGSSLFQYTIIPNTVMTNGMSYLLVAALPVSTSGGTAYVNQIEINETPPFSLTPTAETVSCVSGIPQTFTVVNNFGSTGITGYTWNVGAGWLYNNGSGLVSAPSTITTSATTPTLTLYSSGGTTAPGNVTATVSYSGPLTTFTTNASVPAFVTPTAADLPISGPSPLCTSGTYSITNLPTGSEVAWSASSPVGIVSISSPASTSTTITKTAIGTTQLTATLSNVCGTSTPIVVTESLTAGTPAPTDISGFTPGEVFQPNSQPDFSSTLGTNWTVFGGTLVEGQGTHYIATRVADVNSGYFIVTVTASNACGTSTPFSMEGTIVPSTGPPPPPPPLIAKSMYNVTPNPANQTLTITSAAVNSSTQKRITIFDASGHQVNTVAYGALTTQVTLNVSSLTPGIYFIQIMDVDNKAEIKKVVIRH